MSAAQTACRTCPLIVDCLYRAVVEYDVAGYVAGTTSSQRAQIRCRLDITVDPENFDTLAGVTGPHHQVKSQRGGTPPERPPGREPGDAGSPARLFGLHSQTPPAPRASRALGRDGHPDTSNRQRGPRRRGGCGRHHPISTQPRASGLALGSFPRPKRSSAQGDECSQIPGTDLHTRDLVRTNAQCRIEPKLQGPPVSDFIGAGTHL
jgi:Transcription factor WhiB